MDKRETMMRKKSKKRNTSQQATSVANTEDEHLPKGKRAKRATSSMPPSFRAKGKSPIDMIRNAGTGSTNRKRRGAK